MLPFVRIFLNALLVTLIQPDVYAFFRNASLPLAQRSSFSPVVRCYAFLAACLGSAAQRQQYNFNRGWLLKIGDIPGASDSNFSDSDWKRVTVPHAWNEDDAYRVSIHDQATGVAWYRKHFKLELPSGNKVFVQFEGVRQAAEVYLNGHQLGRSENGVMAFGYDLFPYLHDVTTF